ncbi:MAG: hypothetical protein ACJAWS_002722 [Oleiphilaceae bacterium]|jgi:hypothetical protein
MYQPTLFARIFNTFNGTSRELAPSKPKYAVVFLLKNVYILQVNLLT